MKKGKSTAQLLAEVRKLRSSGRAREHKLTMARKAIILEKKRRQERADLEKELKELKNPGSTAFKKNVRKGLRSGGRGIWKGILTAGEAVDLIAKDIAARKRNKRRK